MKHKDPLSCALAAWARRVLGDRRVRLLATSVVLFAALIGLTGWVLPLSDYADATFLGKTIYSNSGDRVAMVGDVNGDGYDDFLIGAYNGNVCYKQSGGAYLLLGRPAADWGAGFDIGQADAAFCGEDWSDFAGRGLAPAGDVNGDGYGDFLIGAYGYNAPGVITDTGKVYLILGRSEADWGREFLLANADASFVGEATSDMAGYSVSGAGDVDGDGYDDFIVGAYLHDTAGLTDTGKVYLFLGRAGADWGREFSVASADASFVGEQSFDYAGFAVSGAGDVNGDGRDDFLIGSYGNDGNGTLAGKAYLILGRAAANWGQNVSLASADAAFLGEAIGSQAGYAVAGAGDVNGDGYGDFLIGANYDSEVANHAGQAYLILGRASANWGRSFTLANADASYRGAHAGDAAGAPLSAAGDVNGDGYDDFLVAAFRFEPTDVLTDSGRVYLVLGRAAGWQMDVDLAGAETPIDILAFDGEAAEDRAGTGLAGGGDVNGDGLSDLLIGAPLNDERMDRAGKTYLGLGKGLTFVKTASADVVAPGAGLTYTLHYANTNVWDVHQVRIIDRVPAGLTYLGCSGGVTCTHQGQLVSWYLGTIISQTNGAVQLFAQVPGDAALGTLITNTAWITAPNRLNPLFSQVVVRIGTALPTPTRSMTATPSRTVMATPTGTIVPTSTPTMCVPSLLSPQPGAVLDNGRTDFLDDIVWDFDWSDCPGATHYHLYVIGPTATIPVVSDETLTASSYHHVAWAYISEVSLQGWMWKVRAKIGGEWGPWSETRTFDVEPPDMDPPTGTPTPTATRTPTTTRTATATRTATGGPPQRWIAFLPIVLKGTSPAPPGVATPTATTESIEHCYADRSAESYQSWEVGKGFAVLYDSIPPGRRMVRARFYLRNPAPIQVHVWNHERQDLVAPFAAYPTVDGWFEVDLMEHNLVTSSQPFYVGLTYSTDYQPDVGVDVTSPRGHSYEVDGAYFELKPSLNYMICVVVERA